MRSVSLADRARLAAAAVSAVAAVAAAAMLFPVGASALELRIVDQGSRGPEDVYVTVVGQPGNYDVTGMANDTPKKLSEIPGQALTIEKLISGRIYISYGAGVKESVPFNSPIRFDWAELTVTPASSDVANLTAVDQFGIGMRLDTYGVSSEHLETVGDANSDTVFAALQQIPGGPQATVKDSGGNVLRVISPLHSDAYPDLSDYVRSMSGKTVVLHTAFFGAPFTTSKYSGTFAADGSIALSGTSNPPGAAPPTIALGGGGLIEDIYTGAHTPNNLEGAIRRDLLAGFSTGLWGGKYGNDALSFCSNPITTAQGSWCPNGFNKPAFGDARTGPSPFPTCEQYAAVINQYTDSYGNPYSDASKKVTVGLSQQVSGGAVKTLRLTILPDSGNAQPQASGNPSCGAASQAQAPARLRLNRSAKVKGRTVRVGSVRCSGPCGRVRAVAKRGHRVLARMFVKRTSRVRRLVLRLTRAGRRALTRAGRLKTVLNVWVRPSAGATKHMRRSLLLVGRAGR